MKTTRTKRIGKWHLPPECIACGAEDAHVKARTTTEKVCHGEIFQVEHAHWKCQQCGVGVLGPDEAAEVGHATVAAYQRAHGLLTAADLINARRVTHWSQSDLAERTSLGVATIKRLESGTTVQTEANDQLLRRVLGIANSSEVVFVVCNREHVHAPTSAHKSNPRTIFHPQGKRIHDWTLTEEETLAC
jgi:putative zinc finger/helix-turn-helix YgiT family protein